MFSDDLLGTRRIFATVPTTMATAGDDDEWPIFEAPIKCKVTRVALFPATAIVGHGTNFAVVTAMQGAVEVAEKTYDTPTTDDVAAFAAGELILSATAANRILEVGERLTFAKDGSAGTGMVIDGMVLVEYEPVGS